MKTLISTIALFGILLFTQSCSKPFDEIDSSTTPDLGIPLLDAKIQLKEVIDGLNAFSYLSVNPDGSYTFKYSTTFPTTTSFNIFDSMPVAQIPVYDTAIIVPFPVPQGSRLDVIDLSKGKFKFSFTSPLEQLNVTVKIPQFTKNNVPLSKTFTINVGGKVTDSIDLNGYHIEPDVNGKIALIYDARRANGTRTTILGLTNYYEFAAFNNKFIKGYFGPRDLASTKDSISIDFFKNLNFQGEIKFFDPKVTLTIENSFGMPLYVKLSQSEVTPSSGSKFAMTGPLSNGLTINYPSLTQVGQYKQTTVTQDKSNSNVVALVNALPTKIVYKVDGLMNPDTTNKTSGFASDTSRLRLKMDIDIPALLSAKNFLSQDTFSIDFSKFSNVRNVEMKLVTENGLPLELTMQGYFLNAQNQRLDSLFTLSKMILPAAPVGADGIPTSSAKGWTLIPIETAKFDKIRSSTKMIIKYSFATTANGSVAVKLNQSQSVSLKIGLKVGAKQ